MKEEDNKAPVSPQSEKVVFIPVNDVGEADYVAVATFDNIIPKAVYLKKVGKVEAPAPSNWKEALEAHLKEANEFCLTYFKRELSPIESDFIKNSAEWAKTWLEENYPAPSTEKEDKGDESCRCKIRDGEPHKNCLDYKNCVTSDNGSKASPVATLGSSFSNSIEQDDNGPRDHRSSHGSDSFVL